MKRLLVFFALVAVVFTACTTVKYIPVKEKEYITVRDSVYLRDTLVRIELEKARISDFVDVNDTLVLSDAYSRATAFVDTAGAVLRGSIETIRPYVEGNVAVKEKIVYRDSVRSVEVPVPVEIEKQVKYVPWYTKALAFLGILSIIAAVLWVLKKVYLKK